MRANYEAALAENKRRAEDAWNRRYWRRMTEDHLRNSEIYIIQAYCKQPYSMQELQSLMKEFALPEANQKRILDELQQHITAVPAS